MGFKPTYGRVSRHGLIAFASSLDTPGILTRNVHDSLLVCNAISGYDKRDSTSLNENETLSETLNSPNESKPLQGLRVGIPTEFNVKELPHEIRLEWDRGVEMMVEMGTCFL